MAVGGAELSSSSCSIRSIYRDVARSVFRGFFLPRYGSRLFDYSRGPFVFRITDSRSFLFVIPVADSGTFLVTYRITGTKPVSYFITVFDSGPISRLYRGSLR